MDWLKKIKDGQKHYRMEQFSIMFCLLLTSLMVVTGVCFFRHSDKQNTELSEKAIYTTKFRASRTDASGEVIDVYTSEDKTQAFLLLKFDDIDKISLNADNYQMFLTGASVAQNKERLDGTPSGSIYMFNSTGYMGIYLVNQDGFGPQILDLVVRANTELEPVKSDDVSEEVEDESFVKHDQFRVYFNPGANQAKTLACLNTKQAPSAVSFYNEAVVKHTEEDLHSTLETAVDQMRVDLNRIDEYTERAVNMGISVPEVPDLIRGDKVITNEDGSYTYKPAVILQGGYDVDWQNRSVIDGFLGDLIAKTNTPSMTIDQYFAMMNKERNLGAHKDLDVSDIEWRLQDGTIVKDLSGSESSRYTELMKACDNLKTAWTTYYGHKSTYQRETLETLLSLEAQAELVRVGSSINTQSNVLQCY